MTTVRILFACGAFFAAGTVAGEEETVLLEYNGGALGSPTVSPTYTTKKSRLQH